MSREHTTATKSDRTEDLVHPLFYLAQERAFAPGIVKEWPKVFRMPRKVPHGRLVRLTHADVIAELRRLGYVVTGGATQPSGEVDA